jgi:hypothetical protein
MSNPPKLLWCNWNLETARRKIKNKKERDLRTTQEEEKLHHLA